MDKLVSIIVPVYNAERYLEECLDSIISQTYKRIEIILINDGSKDNSLCICNNYRKKDPRIKIIDKKNEGVSCARNDGLNIATGDYITFVDADDYIDETYVEKMVLCADEKGYDIVICGFEVHNSVLVKNDNKALETFCNGTTKDAVLKAIISASTDRIFGYVWRTLFTKECILNIKFDSTVKISEDFMFLLMAINNSKTCGTICEELYHYRCNEFSATAKYMPSLHSDMNKINSWMYEEICKKNPDYAYGYNCCAANTYLRAIQNVCRKGSPYHFFKRLQYARMIKVQYGYLKNIRFACVKKSKLSRKSYISLKALALHFDWLYILLFSIKEHTLTK